MTVKIPGNQCYSCWYFARVVFTNPAETGYKLSTSKIDYAGTQYKKLEPGNVETVNIIAAQWSFTLDTMQNWEIVMSLSEGDASL